MRLENLDNLVYPVGSSNGIDPMYSEHINNIPYAAPPKAVDATEPKFQEGRKKSTIPDPGWIRPPQILLVEDDPTCRRIGSKFLYAFHCAIDSAVCISLYESRRRANLTARRLRSCQQDERGIEV
jgi:osomolarity two-component system response regulator SKN7